MIVIKFYIPRIRPIRFVIQDQSDLCECKNWYLENREQVAFMVDLYLTHCKKVEITTFTPANILDRLEKLKAP